MDRQPQSKWVTTLKVSVIVLFILIPFTTLLVPIILIINHLNHLRRTTSTQEGAS